MINKIFNQEMKVTFKNYFDLCFSNKGVVIAYSKMSIWHWSLLRTTFDPHIANFIFDSNSMELSQTH